MPPEFYAVLVERILGALEASFAVWRATSPYRNEPIGIGRNHTASKQMRLLVSAEGVFTEKITSGSRAFSPASVFDVAAFYDRTRTGSEYELLIKV